MGRYTDDTLVTVHPFVRRDEGESVTIGDHRRQMYLSIPRQGLVILDSPAGGDTVAGARRRYLAAFGEDPDLEDFLEALEQAGLVEVAADPTFGSPATAHAIAAPQGRRLPGGHGEWITQTRARRLCRPATAAVAAAVVLAGAVLVVADPSVVPGPRVLVFTRDLGSVTLGLFVFALAGIALHELGHLVVARAAGVPARLSLGHRLWILVAETDMTGIWMADKRARYAAFLAGPAVDAASASLLLALLWSRAHGLVLFSPFEAQLAGAGLWLYLLRLLWQCFVFVRTDFYFVIATALGCKNLLGDTENYLRNLVARAIGSDRVVDQSSVPAPEMRAIRRYSLVWLAGRAVAFGTLFLVTLPVIWRYITGITPLLLGRKSRYSVVDGLEFSALGLGIFGAGLFMWMKALTRGFIERRRHVATV